MSTFLWAFLAFAIGLTVGHSMAISTTLEHIAELQAMITSHSQAMNKALIAKNKYEELAAELQRKIDMLDDIEELDA